MKEQDLINADGEVRELTLADMKKFRPASEILPKIFPPEITDELLKRKPGQRGKQKNPKKLQVTIRYKADTLEYFRSQGRGWQSKLTKALDEWVSEHR